jgi:hypothetical protein
MGERKRDLIRDFICGGVGSRKGDGHSMLNGHGQGGDHEKHQQEKHSIDHRNDFDTGFLLRDGWQSHLHFHVFVGRDLPKYAGLNDSGPLLTSRAIECHT